MNRVKLVFKDHSYVRRIYRFTNRLDQSVMKEKSRDMPQHGMSLLFFINDLVIDQI